MKRIEYTYPNKAEKPEGPWSTEPDKVQWVDEETGLPCIIRRNDSMGFWCGYVGVPRSHPYFEKEYGEVDVEVHGGLTFSDRCSASEDPHDICHVVEEGEDDEVWWLGFDCGHYRDASPYMGKIYREDIYRDQAYVMSECASLAKQLKGAIPS
jgi:hypothetical protein